MSTTPDFAIFDDFLDQEAWTEVWSHFQFTELLPVSRASGAWKLDDGVPLGGQEILTPRGADGPDDHPLSLVVRGLFDDQRCDLGPVGDGWDRVSARPYVYPAGTALSWHVDDSELFAGAFVYYAHPHWDAHWGGELLVADRHADAEPLPIMGHRFQTEPYSEELLEPGSGTFVMPRPNRLVLIGGAPHAVAAVRAAAGQNVRASVCGFFLRPN
jgi:2OG-Fe(II) oxygenase superfamily